MAGCLCCVGAICWSALQYWWINLTAVAAWIINVYFYPLTSQYPTVINTLSAIIIIIVVALLVKHVPNLVKSRTNVLNKETCGDKTGKCDNTCDGASAASK